MSNRVDYLRECVIRNIINNVVLNEAGNKQSSGSGGGGTKAGGGPSYFTGGVAGLESDNVFFPTADVIQQQVQQPQFNKAQQLWFMNNWQKLPRNIQAQMLDLLKKKKKKRYEY